MYQYLSTGNFKHFKTFQTHLDRKSPAGLTNTRGLETAHIGWSESVEVGDDGAGDYVLHQVTGSLSPSEARVPSELWGAADIGIH